MEPSSDPGADPVLGEGHHTVVLVGTGHRTLEVTRAGPDFRTGPFIASYLCGPDNESDYRAFAHITPRATAGSGVASGTTRPSPGPWWPIPHQRASDGVRGCGRCGPRCDRCIDVGKSEMDARTRARLGAFVRATTLARPHARRGRHSLGGSSARSTRRRVAGA
jgi:hypothetical protein